MPNTDRGITDRPKHVSAELYLRIRPKTRQHVKERNSPS